MSPPLKTLANVLGGLAWAPALLCCNGARLKRGELDAAIRSMAAQLQSAGIRAGDVVSIAEANTAEFVVAFLGVAYARAVAAPLNPNYRTDEFKFYMDDAASKLLLVPATGNEAAEAAAAQLRVPVATIALKQTSPGQTSVALSSRTGSMTFRSNHAFKGGPQPDDVVLFLHTSGTTSRPKGVPLTHSNLVASLANIVATYELTERDRSYLVMPLFHVHGLMAGLLAALAVGAAVIIPDGGKFSARAFWKDCVDHGATFYTAVPTIHQVLLARAAQDYPAAHPPPLRFIRSCSASLALATLQQMEDAFKVPVLEAYAMTEASHQITSNPLPRLAPHKPGSVGRPQGSVQVAVLDGDNTVLPPKTIGEVCIRGPNVTKGYLNNPKANQEAFAGGWFHTGDQGWVDGEGYLTLTGRLKELINRGGEKISPLEVDGVLLSHPAVAEAVCFGAPDDKYGEAVAAAVVLKGGTTGNDEEVAKSIQKHCGTKLATFKVPVQVFVTQALPKTATGKIQRRFMVDHFIKGAGAPRSKL